MKLDALIAQHRALIRQCAELAHAYTLTRTTADQAQTRCQVLDVEREASWQCYIEQEAATQQLYKAFSATLRQRETLFRQIKEQTNA